MPPNLKNKIKIFIADDHFVVRQGLKHILSQTSDMVVVGEAEDGNETLKKLDEVQADVVLMDIEMPGKSGWEVLMQLKNSKPEIAVLILSIFSEDHYGLRLIKAGAAGYLTKSSAGELLLQAVRKVAAGGKFVSPNLAENLIDELDRGLEKPPHAYLSEREFQVYILIVLGKKMKDIADELSVSITTISTHRANILEKMNMKSNAELIQYAYKNGLLPGDPGIPPHTTP